MTQWYRVGAVATAGLMTCSLLINPAAQASAPPVATVAAGNPTAASTSPATRAARKAARKAQRMSLRSQVVATAMGRLGSSYVWGGSGPDSFDCSGLVMWTYQQVLGVSLPHYSGAQMQVSQRPIERDRLRRGDLLFYGEQGSDHVTMYIGRGQQIGASSPRTGIVVNDIDSPYYVERYAGAGRVIRGGAPLALPAYTG